MCSYDCVWRRCAWACWRRRCIPCKVVQTPVSLLSMYGTAVSNHPTRSCSLHPDSIQVSNGPSGNHLRFPVAKSFKQCYSLRKHNQYRSTLRDPATTCYVVVEEDICRPSRIPLWPRYASPNYPYPNANLG